MLEKLKQKNKYLPLMMTLFFYSIGGSMGHPVTPTMIIERNLDSSLFGTAFAAMSITNFLTAPLWGKLCNYMPTRKIMSISCLGYMLGQSIFGFCTNGAMAIGGRAISGIFIAGLHTALPSYIINTSGSLDERSRALTLNMTIQNVASACGYFIGGMMGAYFNVEITFTTLLIIIFISAILFYVTSEDDTPYKQVPDHKLTFAEANPFAAFMAARSFMTNTLAICFAAVVFGSLGQVCLEQVFNYYIQDQFGQTSASNGIFKAAIAIGTLVCNTTVTMKLVRKTDINKTYLPVMLAQILPLALILVTDSLLPFAVGYILFSIINAVRLPIQQNIAAQYGNANNSGSVIGFYNSMNSVGSIFGALFAGLIYEYDPFLPFQLAFGAFSVGIFFAFIYLNKYKKGLSQ